MDDNKVPYKVTMKIVSFDGEWTAEQIDSGEAGEAKRVEEKTTWFEPTPNGTVEVTDKDRIAELEAKVRGNVEGA